MHELTPDLEQARRFLAALDATGQFTFQTFCDDKHVDLDTKKGLARKFHGDLATHAHSLAALQRKRAGAFVTVNKTDLKGRKEENITSVRAVYVDLYGSPLEPVHEFPLKPSIIIESSPGRWHAYWLEHFRASQCPLQVSRRM